MLRQRLGISAGILVVAYGPDIVSRDSSDHIEGVCVRSRVGTGHRRPGAAIPVFNQRARIVGLEISVSHGPDIVSRQRGHTIEVVVTGSGIRAGHNTPGGTIPM